MHHSHDPQRLILGGIRDQVFPNPNKPQRPRSQVRTPISPIGKWNQLTNRVQNFSSHSVGRIRTIHPNKIPNLIEIK